MNLKKPIIRLILVFTISNIIFRFYVNLFIMILPLFIVWRYELVQIFNELKKERGEIVKRYHIAKYTNWGFTLIRVVYNAPKDSFLINIRNRYWIWTILVLIFTYATIYLCYPPFFKALIMQYV